MIRTIFIVVISLHGLLHLLGFAKAFGFAELPQLTVPISRPSGALWLAAAVFLGGTAAALVLWPRGWWILGLLGLLTSQGAIALSWADASFGTIVNLVLLVGVAYGFASQGLRSLGADYRRSCARTAVARSPSVLTEADLAALPEPVQRYVRASGTAGP